MAVVNDPDAFATSISKILGSKLSTSKRADPVLSRMYAPHWTIIPNLGIDLVLPPLLRLLPVHVAGRIVIGVAVLLPVFGTVAYSRAVFGTLSAVLREARG